MARKSAGEVEEVDARRLPRSPAGCRAYMRKELTRRFPEIVSGFVKAAEEGSCPHVKLATELLGGGPVKRRRSKAATEILKKMAEI